MRYLIALAAALLVLVASAIEPPKPEKKPSDPATKTEQPAEQPATLPVPPAEQPQAAAVEEEEEELPPLPADTIPAGPPPARFNPTEKVRADFPVSFPIDI